MVISIPYPSPHSRDAAGIVNSCRSFSPLDRDVTRVLCVVVDDDSDDRSSSSSLQLSCKSCGRHAEEDRRSVSLKLS